MRIVLAQINPLIGDIEGNGEKILSVCSNLSLNNFDLILTPELSLWGYPPKDLLLEPSLHIKQNEVLQKIAKNLNTNNPNIKLLVGIAEQASNLHYPSLFNSMALIAKGEIEIVARKQLLPSYDIFDEKRYFRPSNDSYLFSLESEGKVNKIGLTLCEDIWVEDKIQKNRTQGCDPIEKLKNKNIDILINISASPYSFTKGKVREEIVANACKRLNCPAIYLNQVGGNDELIFDGSSFVMNKNGNLIFSLPSFEENIAIYDTSKNLESSFLKKEVCTTESIFKALVLGLKDYCRKCGFKRVLIGLSGGIDSALVTTIAVFALGSENVKVILMPSPWSSKGSIDDSINLANRLNIKYKITPIHELMNLYSNCLLPTLGELPKGLTAENLQSRIRGTLLMAIANQENYLLLSTGNKSEIAMGYCTLYGDMNGGLSVIGDMYKTTVFKVSKWLDSKQSLSTRKFYNIPLDNTIIGEEIRTKPPSAELRKDQLDTDSLPDYEILDPILKKIIEERFSKKELLKSGHNEHIIDKIQNLIKKSEFKRRQAPPVLKISNRAFDSGWRLPIASK
mgnify:CR=1 FL=1